MVFHSVKQALAFYRYKNPARQRFFNLLETQSSTRNNELSFSGKHPADIWASIVASIEYAKDYLDYDGRQIVDDCYLAQDLLHPIEAAEKHFISERTVYNRLRKFNKELERDLQRRQLLTYRE
jgi:hypothetical protein